MRGQELPATSMTDEDPVFPDSRRPAPDEECVELAAAALPRVAMRYDASVIARVNKSLQSPATSAGGHHRLLDVKGAWFVQSMIFAAVFMTVHILTESPFAGKRGV